LTKCLFERLQSTTTCPLKTKGMDPICFMSILDPSPSTGVERIMTVSQNRTFRIFKYMPINKTFEPEGAGGTLMPFAHDVVPSPNLFAVTKDGKILFSCGHWDNSFRVTYLDPQKADKSFAVYGHDGFAFLYPWPFLFFSNLAPLPFPLLPRRGDLPCPQRRREVFGEWVT